MSVYFPLVTYVADQTSAPPKDASPYRLHPAHILACHGGAFPGSSEKRPFDLGLRFGAKYVEVEITRPENRF